MTTAIRRSMRGILLCAALTASGAQDAPPERERALIGVLQSDAPPAEKAIACKRLAVCGTSHAVPALAPLLADPRLASWARIALEAIPDPAAVDALLAAMDRLKGALQVGVINSIGVRRDARAVDALVKKLRDADPDVASAAAVALGRIGGDPAARALEPLLTTAPAGLRPAVAEGGILCAERLLAEGRHADAVKLYDAVRGANVSQQRTIEAVRGAILARRSAGVPLLIEQLQSADKAFFDIGLHTAREMPGREVTRALLAQMERTPPERQPHLLLALADRGGDEVLPAALKAAGSGPLPLRLAAFGVLERRGSPSGVPVLLSAAADDDVRLSQAAKSVLTRLSGAEVDAAILDTLKRGDEKARRAAVELAGLRRLTPAMPALLQAAADPTAPIRTASLKVLGDLAGLAEVPSLLDILLRSQDTAAAENALSAVCARLTRPAAGHVIVQKAVYGDLAAGRSIDVTAKVAALVKAGALSVEASNAHFGDPSGGVVKQLRVDYTVNGLAGSATVRENESMTFAGRAAPPALVDPLCAALAQAPPAVKPALLRVLRSVGGPKVLAAIRSAAADAHAETRETALRVLCDWPAPDALPDLMPLARAAADPRFKILALRGVIRLAPLQAVSAERKAASLREAMDLAERNEEKTLVLAALGGIPAPGALALVTPHLGTPELKEAACLAAVGIAEKIAPTHPDAVAEAMQQVLKAAPGEAIALRARALAEKK